ncbi:polysialyltransferase family glycosyltransferase [Microbacterium sp.]|uniref:polysialyltransferase family glycosyltransferase n=1 Tax=Microbacterium sp. TaxID=51671 RepID=UPI002735BD6C|nr:polysialyltransferase family glycosyltransferase [Microbacterium sp.]MDP3949303.1 polysialyltransferase family glycosyltransferase [Microbacterium sp.]
MTQLFVLHSAYGLTTASAALDEGLIEAGEERVLVPVNSARIPETSLAIHEQPNLRSLCARFDRIEPLDEILSPLHPSSWHPVAADLPILKRLLSRAWNLDDDLELFVQSPQVAPARTLLTLFPNARITIIGDGLMTYSPMRVKLPRTVVERVGRVVYADVVPGVEPLVLGAADGGKGAQRMPVPPAAFRKVLQETAAADPQLDALADGTPTVLVLGQYLSALGLVSAAEEIAMQGDMIDRAAAWNPRRIVFKPHPSAPPLVTDAVRERAEARGAEFVEYRGVESAELVAERLDVDGVVAGFSTALPTVQTLFDRPIASSGTQTVLRRLTPYENSNRVPATIVDALTRADGRYRDPAQLQLLIDAVGYAMQPKIAAHLRPRAEEMLDGLDPAERERYFDLRRLVELRLPGAPVEPIVRRALRSVGGVGRAEEIRLTLRGARRRAARVWKVARGL